MTELCKRRPLEGRRVLITGGSGFIGTNLVALMVACGADVVNADICAPSSKTQLEHWRRCDVQTASELDDLVMTTKPHFVVHMAARTDTSSDVVADYAVNWVGTTNATRAAARGETVERFVLVSSQFVLGPGIAFESETQFAPHTAYGRSKVDAERSVRDHPPDIPWTIVRPTNVWGPWHARYQREFWRVLGKGLYVHPSSPDPVRSYGYVGSVCLQILAVLRASPNAVHGRALYLGDEPVLLSEWVDAFSIALRGRSARRLSGAVMARLAQAGDVARRVGVPAPLDGSRFRSMTEDYPTPMGRTAEVLGRLPSVPLSVGVSQTVAWLQKEQSPNVESWLAYDPLPL